MILSLFSGAGGLDWGFHVRGIPLGFANDIKEDAAQTYARNTGARTTKARDLGGGKYSVWDVSETFTTLNPEPMSILLGGPPCQDFSVMRGVDTERRGMLTLRGRLYLHFARYVAIMRPAAFVFENVPGLLSSNGGRDIQAVLEDLENPGTLARKWAEQHNLRPETTPPPPEDLLKVNPREIPPYHIVRRLVDMTGHGLPQSRKRLILIGLRQDIPFQNQQVRALEEFLEGDPLLRTYPLTSMEALEGRVLTDLEDVYQEIVREYNGAFGRGGAVDEYLRTVGEQANPKHFEEAMVRHEQILRLMGWYGRSLSEIPGNAFEDGSHVIPRETAQVRQRMSRILPGENHEAVRGTEYEVEGRGFSLVYRRLHPLRPAYTVVAYGGGGTWGYHYRRSRSKLTNRERARLQGFPDHFTFHGTATQVRAQIGEAVPPLFSLRLAEALLGILNDVGALVQEPNAVV